MVLYWLWANLGLFLFELTQLFQAWFIDTGLTRAWILVLFVHTLIFCFCEFIRLWDEEIKDEENHQ